MKIECEKCHQDISVNINSQFDHYHVGRIICPHCNMQQKRYISEADILLYFGINEFIYMLLSFALYFIFNRFDTLYAFLIIAITMVIYYFLVRELSARIYLNGHMKKEIMNKEFAEDAKEIERQISWQFMLFFAICISFLTIEESRSFFIFAMPLAVILTFIKYYLKVKSEKESK